MFQRVKLKNNICLANIKGLSILTPVKITCAITNPCHFDQFGEDFSRLYNCRFCAAGSCIREDQHHR